MLILFLPVVGAFVCYELLLKTEHDDFREDWERDGRPRGMFWRPAERLPGEDIFSGSWAGRRLLCKWLVITPVWTQMSDRATALLYAYRACAALYFLLLIPCACVMMPRAGR